MLRKHKWRIKKFPRNAGVKIFKMQQKKVLKLLGQNIPQASKMLPHVQVIASRQENKTSMCVDVLKKRQSEVDFINGRVVALAKK